MQEFKIQMPGVSACTVSECAYNNDDSCCARAITVGDGASAHCDTFFQSAAHCTGSRNAGVGACKVSNCRHNEDLECQADGIQVGHIESEVYCLTYASR